MPENGKGLPDDFNVVPDPDKNPWDFSTGPLWREPPNGPEMRERFAKKPGVNTADHSEDQPPQPEEE